MMTMAMTIMTSCWFLMTPSLLLSAFSILLSSSNNQNRVDGFSVAISSVMESSFRRSGIGMGMDFENNFHLNNRRRMNLNLSTTSPEKDGKEEGDDDDDNHPITLAFRTVSNNVLKEDTKRTNMELAYQGQKFSSIRRRFDFDGSSLLRSESDPDQDSTTPTTRTMFRRDPSTSTNVVKLLMQMDMTEEDAQRESMSLVEQSYTRMSMGTDDSSDAIGRGILKPFDNDDDFFTVHPISGSDTFHILVDQIAKRNDGMQLEIRDRWEGNVYISEAFLLRGEIVEGQQQKDSEGPCVRVVKMLRFEQEEGNDNAKDGLTMIVKTTLFQEEVEGNVNDDDDDCDDGTKETITSEEVYRHLHHNYDANGTALHVLSSPLHRVPGCVANVNVRTTLIPIHNHGDESSVQQYRVFIDGEADAVLSRGLLSVLQRVLSSPGILASHVLDMAPNTVTDRLRLRNVLSKGRNDGLASMLSIIQDQIRNMLSLDISKIAIADDKEEEISNTGTTTDNLSATTVTRKPSVAMLLSGGVDSSVAMNLLVRQGYDVTAFYLKIWLEDELAHLGQCPWEDDYAVCEEVCRDAGVPLEAISLQREYKERVISYTIHEARKGRTPNPDIMCNSRVKFGCFYEAISKRDFDYVASGHYAQLEDVAIDTGSHQSGDHSRRKRLLRAPDPVKDQSYFLAALTQAQLDRVLFPIGHLEKSRVRELAEEFDLPNKKRPDSQGLCFLGKVRFDEFLAAYLGNEPGDIVDAATGDVIGRHKGIWFHTVGQRKGIGKVLDPKATAKGPWYVVAKDTSRRLIITSNQYDEDKFESTRREFVVEDIKWISGVAPQGVWDGIGAPLSMKIRHGPKIVTGNLKIENKDGDIGKVVLDRKDGGLAPGQFVVFYDDLECLGSGIISEKHWIDFLSSGDWMGQATNKEPVQ